MMGSWRKNYVKGYRKRKCPKARRLFVRVKQTLCKLEGDRLRVSKRSWRASHHPDRIHLPIHIPDENTGPITEKIAWDSNMLSFDGYSPKRGWIKIDTRLLPQFTSHPSRREEAYKERHRNQGRLRPS
jgi:putative transposase